MQNYKYKCKITIINIIICKEIRSAICSGNHAANLSKCLIPPKNIKIDRYQTIKNYTNSHQSKQFTSNLSFAPVAKGVNIANADSIDTADKVNSTHPIQSDSSFPLLSAPGFNKFNFPDIFNADIDNFIYKLQTILNLLEKIDKLFV